VHRHAHKPAGESIEGRHTRTDLKGQRLKCSSADVPLIAKINRAHVQRSRMAGTSFIRTRDRSISDASGDLLRSSDRSILRPSSSRERCNPDEGRAYVSARLNKDGKRISNARSLPQVCYVRVCVYICAYVCTYARTCAATRVATVCAPLRHLAAQFYDHSWTCLSVHLCADDTMSILLTHEMAIGCDATVRLMRAYFTREIVFVYISTSHVRYVRVSSCAYVGYERALSKA